MMLHERFRPRTWAEVAGQDKAISELQFLRDHGGFGGQLIAFVGLPGTGKNRPIRSTISIPTLSMFQTIVSFSRP